MNTNSLYFKYPDYSQTKFNEQIIPENIIEPLSNKKLGHISEEIIEDSSSTKSNLDPSAGIELIRSIADIVA